MTTEAHKLQLLENFVSPDIYEIISKAETYMEVLNLLNKVYIQENSKIYVRYILATKKQQTGETLDLQSLTKDCNFQQVTVTKHKDLDI